MFPQANKQTKTEAEAKPKINRKDIKLKSFFTVKKTTNKTKD